MAERRDKNSTCERVSLRVLALSAPHWPARRRADVRSLQSATPFSLLNALRGAFRELSVEGGPWEASNLRREADRIASIGMFDCLPDAEEWLMAGIQRAEPNLVLLGAMSLSVPGAVECARLVRASLGQGCVVVLGGKHATETLWLEDGRLIIHQSARALLETGLFDFIVSGDGEEVVAQFGSALSKASFDPNEARERIWTLLRECRGEFVVAANDGSGGVRYASGSSPLDQDSLPAVYEFYPVNAKFDVAVGRPTAHGYSYSSRGCIYSCYFCSESNRINGPISAGSLLLAGSRLARQFAAIERVQSNRREAAPFIFVEDSIFLQGYLPAWLLFCRERSAAGRTASFGIQLTVDIIAEPRRLEALRSLVAAGLSYVFIGIETSDPRVAPAMAKNVNKAASWLDRSEQAVKALSDLGVAVGVSLLFGLGELHETRMELLEAICRWRANYGQPVSLSLNWAVRHPLRHAGPDQPTYLDWGIEEGDQRYGWITSLFGEASVRYCMEGTSPPSLDELRDISVKISQMEDLPCARS